jgi:hypothetical protein
LKAYHSIQAWFPFIFDCSKNGYRHCKTIFTCWVSLFCNGFTLGPTAHATLVGIDKPKKMTCKIAPNLNYNLFILGHISNTIKIIPYTYSKFLIKCLKNENIFKL